MEKLFENCVKIAELHERVNDKELQYGTAGFRYKANELDHVLYRMGLFAVVRSKAMKGATIGVMITASHNPEEDNGVKLVDPLGEMIEVSWEKYAAELANVTDSDIPACLQSIMSTEEVDPSIDAKVVFARDTRPSSKGLSEALRDGIQVFQGQLNDYGLLTTPQLHYMVRCINTREDYGQPTEEGYYKKLAQAFCSLRSHVTSKGNYQPVVWIDGANGIGALKMAEFQDYLDNKLTVHVVNDGSQGILNYQCGADYVKVQQIAPEGSTMQHGMRYASFDGDADRIVFYYLGQDGTFRLLDGDKIATLIAGYLKCLLTDSGIDLDLGLVQTAYANGSSTEYITNVLSVPVACALTGVKHLHHRAQQFDIGVYFEANGHGTILFSDSSLKKIQQALENPSITDEQKAALSNLTAVMDMTNQTVGDAISDLLLVETVLHHQGWSIEDWDAAYTDLPNRLLKVKVNDRQVIQTTDAERKTTAPDGLQSSIDEIVVKYQNGRSFVRPSGTEDVVRVYSEAATREEADMLAYEVSVKVYEMAGGVGAAPSPPSV